MDWLTLDFSKDMASNLIITARNDWSSTLPKKLIVLGFLSIGFIECFVKTKCSRSTNQISIAESL